MADAAEIVAIAEANLGKHGCSVNSAGGQGYYASCTSDQGEWCADFARWVWARAGVDVSGLTAGAGSFPGYGELKLSAPQVGDAVVFGYDGHGYARHVAIVIEVSGGSIYSIGGNEGGSSVVQRDGPYSAAVGNTEFGLPLSGFVAPKGGTPPPPGRTVPSSSVAVAPAMTWGMNSLHVFAVGAGNAVEYRAWDGKAWTGWNGLGGIVSSSYPRVMPVAWGVNHADVFYVGADDHLWHRGWGGEHWNATWDDLGNPGFPPGSPPVAVSQEENSLDVLVTGAHHNTIWRRSWRGSGWSGWSDLGSVVTAPYAAPAACSWGSNRLDVCVVGADNTVKHSGWDGGPWSGSWSSLGGNPAHDPALVSWGSGRLDLFIVGTDGNLYHNYWNGGWRSWEDLGNPGERPRTGPVAVCQGENLLDVFVMGPHNQTVWRRSWDGSAWSGWTSLGHIVSSADATPVVAAWGGHRLDAFVTCSPGNVFHSGWGGGPWSGSWEDLEGNVKFF